MPRATTTAPATAEDSLRAALAACAQRYQARTPKSAAQIAAAKAVMPGGHTRSNMAWPPYSPAIIGGEDAILTDIDGHDYIDFLNDFTVSVNGHSHPRIAAAVRDQLERGMSYGARIEAETQLAQLITERYPAIEAVRFCNSGTEADLWAALTARASTQRPAILGFAGGYYGAVMSFKTGPSPMNVPFDTVVVPYNDVSALETAFAAHGDRLAAVFVEIMLNSGGAIPATRDFVQAIRALCTRHKTLMVVDEVMTARLAYHGLCHDYGVTPDLITLGKMIGGGFSIGAFGGRRDVMALFDTDRPGALDHSGSFNNNVFSMTCGSVAMADILTESALVAMNARGDRLRAALNQALLAQNVPLVFTGLGSVMAVHLSTEAPLRPTNSALQTLVRDLMHMHLLERGFWIARRGMIALSLAITDAHCEALVAAMRLFAATHGKTIAAAHDEAA